MRGSMSKILFRVFFVRFPIAGMGVVAVAFGVDQLAQTLPSGSFINQHIDPIAAIAGGTAGLVGGQLALKPLYDEEE